MIINKKAQPGNLLLVVLCVVILTSPTAMCLWMSSSPCLICGHLLSGTYILEQAEHFWPPYSNAERMVPVTTLSMSADLWTKWKFFPPHSKSEEWEKLFQLQQQSKTDFCSNQQSFWLRLIDCFDFFLSHGSNLYALQLPGRYLFGWNVEAEFSALTFNSCSTFNECFDL